MPKTTRSLLPRLALLLLLTLSTLLTSCKMPAPATPTKADAQTMLTAAALTAEARKSLPPRDTYTPLPSLTPLSVPADALTATLPAAGAVTAIPTAITAGDAPAGDRAEFLADVTVPDGEAHTPSEAFVKTWRLQNTGATTWTTDYSLIFISGALMGGPPSVPMPKAVAPNESVDISVEFTAPAQNGILQSFWKLRNADEQIFGVGPEATDAIWVTISVTGAPTANTTTTPAVPGQIVTSANVTVDKSMVTGNCPQTFRFTVQFTLAQADTVAYVLEAGGDTAFEIKVPPPAIRNLDAGAHSVVYELTFSTDIQGWVRIHFTEPEDVVSEPVNFTLTCQ